MHQFLHISAHCFKIFNKMESVKPNQNAKKKSLPKLERKILCCCFVLSAQIELCFGGVKTSSNTSMIK